jgi:hypothetical protein
MSDPVLRVTAVIESCPAQAMKLFECLPVPASVFSTSRNKLRVLPHLAILICEGLLLSAPQRIRPVPLVVALKANSALTSRGKALFYMPVLAGLSGEVVGEPLFSGLLASDDVHESR